MDAVIRLSDIKYLLILIVPFIHRLNPALFQLE